MDYVQSFFWRWLQSVITCDPSSAGSEALEKIRGKKKKEKKRLGAYELLWVKNINDWKYKIYK